MHEIMNIYTTIVEWCGNLVSIDFWTNLLQTYQYIIVVVGALVEGEMVLILAGAAAYHGYMALPLVMLISFLGAIFHDVLLFFVGRLWGRKLLQRQSKWHNRIQKVARLIQKYDSYFIMSFRFIYGIRTITPLVVGSGPTSFKRYFSLMIISAAVWAIVISYVGYSCAMALETILHHFNHAKKYLAAGLALLLCGGYVFFRRRRQKQLPKNSSLKD